MEKVFDNLIKSNGLCHTSNLIRVSFFFFLWYINLEMNAKQSMLNTEHIIKKSLLSCRRFRGSLAVIFVTF